MPFGGQADMGPKNHVYVRVGYVHGQEEISDILCKFRKYDSCEVIHDICEITTDDICSSPGQQLLVMSILLSISQNVVRVVSSKVSNAIVYVIIL